MTSLGKTVPDTPAFAGAFPKNAHADPRAKGNGTRIALELARIWGMQQQLGLPHDQLSDLVHASLQALQAQAQRARMGSWVDMLLAIQQAIDHRIEQARVAVRGWGTPADDHPAHRATARVMACFYIGLLEVSPLNESEALDGKAHASIAGRLNRHRQAQGQTKEALGHLQQTGLKPPGECAALIMLITVFINALHGLSDPPDGLLHMVAPATADAPHSGECLYAYALTQLQKGRPDRAMLVLDVCKQNAMRRGQRLLAALLLPDLHVSQPSRDDSACSFQFAKERQLILKCWLGQSVHEGGPGNSSGLQAARRADRIERALTFISTHIDLKFTVTELANLCGVSTRTISEDFRAVFHKTGLAYVTEERMRVALKLLHDRSLPLEAVSAKVGFHTQFGFTKAFVRTYGHMPVRPVSEA